ncbi:synergin gamma isoform X2 [Anolis carolinensis]|uniref:synergin gamma isoform X2 n=1 Tax=Anolis carolinensis TaxID=28377 RepID=UPI002F2B45F9
MAAESTHFMRCLSQIHQVIGKANEILSGISRPSVCSEVLGSTPGMAYILGLSEVYRVSKRLERGAKARALAGERLEQALREVDLAWNNLLAFVAFGRAAFQTLDGQLLEPSVGSPPPCPPPDPQALCGVCLTEVKQEPQLHSGNADPVSYQGSHFHAGCANFWLNCVDATLPSPSTTQSSLWPDADNPPDILRSPRS